MKKISAILIIIIGAAVLAYFFLQNRSLSPKKKFSDNYNVILVTIDTLRADHLGCYGYPRDTSPVMDDFADKAVLFKNAIIPSPFTGPSHASMLTGLYPAEHGVLTNGYELDKDNLTLAEALRKHGYQTAAFVAARWVLGEEFGFDQGFEVFKEGKHRERRAAAVNKQAIRWLKKKGNKGSFFAWVHYYDVHCDYNAPEPFFNMFYPNYKGRIDPRGKCGKPHYNKMELNDDDLQYIRALYDAEIRYADNQVGTLFKTIKKLGLSDKTIFIITSDHGESLGERGLIGHNLCLKDYEIHVPLIIKHPELKSAPMRINHQVELKSLMPTILDMLDIKHDVILAQKSFWPLLKGGKVNEKFAYSETAVEKGRNKSYSIRSLDWKLTLSRDSKPELYSLKNTDESNNLADIHPETAASMRDLLEDWIRIQEKTSTDKTQNISQEVIEKLKALGYVNQ
ncbi:MAG: sulfatase-like hydrolase/transferase [Proteobacteria bacterium]|nr:sulfatase-like hydrolase/transferase [Pseudomonadota bacterium]